MLTLAEVAERPDILTYTSAMSDGMPILVRPLARGDDLHLAVFFEGLSPQTRECYTQESYDLAAARSLCDAIARYDKLRLIVEASGRIVGIVEYSFAIMDSDRDRFARYGIPLDPKTDVRFGLCFADDCQGRGLGSAVLPAIQDIAVRFGKRRIILWGGVLASNSRAIRYYEKSGFRLLGRFVDSLGGECLDGMLDLPR